MSLQVWLPLNGNLNNQGLSNVTVVNNGATVNDNGKVGKCYSFDGTDDYIDTGWGNGHSARNISVALWVKPTYIMNRLFIGAKNGSSQRFYITIKGSKYGVGYGNKTDANISSDSVCTLNTWTHLVMTVDNNGEMVLYQDGQLTNTTYTYSTAFNLASNIYVGGRDGGSYSFSCINDVRIYDHCLSPKEVKEISQGLVLHYPLNDVSALMSKCSNITWNQLVQNGDFSNGTTGWTNWGSYTTTSVSNNEITVTKSSTYGLGAMCYSSSVGTVDTSHRYYIAATIKTNTSDVGAYFGFATSGGTVGGNLQCECTSTSFVRLSNI